MIALETLLTGCVQKHAEPSSHTIVVVSFHNSPAGFRSCTVELGTGFVSCTVGLGETGVGGTRSAQPYPVRVNATITTLQARVFVTLLPLYLDIYDRIRTRIDRGVEDIAVCRRGGHE